MTHDDTEATAGGSSLIEQTLENSHPTFSVDTNLFRELGELLVGRDSTALIELIKNSYDADAREVTLYGEALTDSARGYIRIRDNGLGMGALEFNNGFLRIASRTKHTGERRSEWLLRRFTGAKGIGRLAAHKLARVVEINSLRWDGEAPGKRGPNANKGITATINWEIVETQPTLEALVGTDAITVETIVPPPNTLAGTTITLRGLRSAWTKAAHSRFLEEVQAFGPSPVLAQRLPKSAVSKPLLFELPTIRDSKGNEDRGFEVRLEGELAAPEDFWQAKADAAHWILEIDALSVSGQVRYAVAPTRSTAEQNSDAKSAEFSVPHPAPESGPFFQGRVLLRIGQAWEGRSGGIRVFVEGFRLLPYGEQGNDWLSLDRLYTERAKGRQLAVDGLLESPVSTDDNDADYGLLVHPNKNYYGAIFLTQDGSRPLKTLVNREGFVPDAAYERLVSIVQRGIALLTRTRAAATERSRAKRRRERAGDRDEMPGPTNAFREALSDGISATKEARRLVAAGGVSKALELLENAVKRLEQAEEASTQLIGQGAMLRVLASLGTQMAAFIHEINSLVGTAESVDHALRRLREARKSGRSSSREQTQLMTALVGVVADLRRNLERQASYLVEVVTPDARRRRARQKIAERLDAASRLVANVADRSGIRIENGIPATIMSPPMFPAELTTVFSNLLTNAVKAAGKGGIVRATGSREGSRTRIRVENTGIAVDPGQGERWFEPFESTTGNVDAVLGQGMGLGLPITRSVLTEYGAVIRFVRPAPGFATAVEIVFP